MISPVMISRFPSSSAESRRREEKENKLKKKRKKRKKRKEEEEEKEEEKLTSGGETRTVLGSLGSQNVTGGETDGDTPPFNERTFQLCQQTTQIHEHKIHEGDTVKSKSW
ncbi:hypothetical protein EYF80_063904 [Liparis tanakae]|uniref:Uncharacterized protein n=1 Tax=Liparis tanakae TaxID=230148 RepID=A0A4Z2EB39_9TELE|nr:hypothetical protein EYF80_063904 [Liparis tanakae]